MAKRLVIPAVKVPDFDFSLISLDEYPEPVQHLIVAFVELAIELGHRPQRHDLERYGINRHQVGNLCGTYAELLRLSGYRPILQRRAMKPHGSSSIRREDIIQTFRQLAKKQGSTPTRQQIQDLHELGEIPFGVNEVKRLFGARHNNAVKAAGLEPNHDAWIKHTKATTVKALVGWIKVHGRTPASADFTTSNGLPSVPTVVALFDGLDNALRAAGHAPNKNGPKSKLRA